MPVPLRQFGGCVVDGKAFLIGGCDEHGGGRTGVASNQRAFLCFDRATDTWQSSSDDALPTHPTCPQAPLVAAHGGRVYAIAGNPSPAAGGSRGGPTPHGISRPAAVWTYTPGSGRWEEGPLYPTQNAWGAACSLNGSLYAVGGAHGTHPPSGIVFDPRVYVLKELP
jgi:hypothetical protein|eukprot:SAG25_NODE_917_length_4774_cov_6.141176_3_plen_167_part_00